MRKLVTLRTITNLYPIANADFIEVAQVGDWQVIVKKEEFNVGSTCVFFEIDSILPDEPRYSFLGTPKDSGYRLKTMKMKGVISQGLALPLSSFPEIHSGFTIGDDVTEVLKVTKYDNDTTQRCTSNTSPIGKFPSFIPKTDQERIQNLPNYYEQYKDHLWEETLKLDGSSMTCYKVTKELNLYQRVKQFIGIKQSTYHFGVCSRNIELDKDTSSFWSTAVSYSIEDWLPIGYAVQGELIGTNIQSNHEKVDKNYYYIFDVYDINNNRYLLPQERHDFISKYSNMAYHITVVSPAINIFSNCSTFDLLQERVTGQSINPKTVSEGRVYKSLTVPGLSFKCISNKYLLKCES